MWSNMGKISDMHVNLDQAASGPTGICSPPQDRGVS